MFEKRRSLPSAVQRRMNEIKKQEEELRRIEREKEIKREKHKLKGVLDIFLANNQKSILENLERIVKEFDHAHNALLITLAYAQQQKDDELLTLIKESYIAKSFPQDDIEFHYKDYEREELTEKGEKLYEVFYKELAEEVRQSQEDSAYVESQIGAYEFNERYAEEWDNDPSNPNNWDDD